MSSVTWRERVRYRFDKWMSRGPGAIMALLGIVTLVFVVVVALIVILLQAFPDEADTGGFWDIAWGNLMRTLDPGTMGADAGWAFRALMLLVTVGGLIIVASLIGIVSGAFDDKMVELRRGAEPRDRERPHPHPRLEQSTVHDHLRALRGQRIQGTQHHCGSRQPRQDRHGGTDPFQGS
ncbi:MAG TPA: hypothetical protein VGJ24_03740 [Nocardioides sp.]